MEEPVSGPKIDSMKPRHPPQGEGKPFRQGNRDYRGHVLYRRQPGQHAYVQHAMRRIF